MTSATTSSYRLDVDGIGPVEVTLTDGGEGRPFLLLHGGGGPATVAGFATLLTGGGAALPPGGGAARVITPTHPGFGGTTRPEALHTVAGLAALYAALLDRLDLIDVTVVGNSIGGWIAAELALLEPARVGGIVLVNAVGVEVAGHPIADFFSLTMDEVFTLSYHDPDRFRVDLTTLPPAAQAVAAGNRAALAAYAGASMSDPTLIGRLATLAPPALVLWGESDRIVDPDYGRAYAAAIPAARFQLLPDTGHLPQLETPDQLLRAIQDFSIGQAAGGQRGA